LSFAGDAESDDDSRHRIGAGERAGQGSVAPTRIVAATELHEDDIAAAAQSAPSLRSESSFKPPLRGDESQVDDDARSFDAAQRAVARKRVRGDAEMRSASGSLQHSAPLHVATADDREEEEAIQDGVAAAAATDYARLREELKATRKAAAFSGSSGAGPATASSMLTPLQEIRAKYKARHKELGKREADTLSKLLAFKSKLHGAASAAAPTATAESSAAHPRSSGAVTYSGQVLEDEPDSDGAGGAETWMNHKLRFKKHIDDSYRAGDDGLVTVDPLREKDVAPFDRGGATTTGQRSGRDFSGAPPIRRK
jgi:hypothetical protein